MDELPCEEEVGTADWVFDEDAQPVCSHCFETVSPLDHYCGNCGEMAGQWTAYIPWVWIPYWARFFERLWMRVWWCRGLPLLKRVAYLAVIILLAYLVLGMVSPMLLGVPFVLWRKWWRGRSPDCGFTWHGGYR